MPDVPTHICSTDPCRDALLISTSLVVTCLLRCLGILIREEAELHSTCDDAAKSCVQCGLCPIIVALCLNMEGLCLDSEALCLEVCMGAANSLTA